MASNKTQFLFNMGSGWVLQLVSAFVGFFLLPYNIYHLGDESYGLSQIAVSLMMMLNFLSFGMEPTLLRFYSQAIAKNDKEQLRILSSTAQFLLGGLGLVGLLIACALAPAFVRFYEVSPDIVNDTYILIFCLAISFFLQMYSMAFIGMVLGSNRYDKINIRNMISHVLRLVLVVLFYNVFTPSLKWLGIALLLGAVYNFVALLFLAYQEMGKIVFFRKQDVKKSILPSIFSFSVLTFINNVAYGASIQLPIMVIGRTLGTDMVTAFAPAVTIAAFLANLLRQMSQPLVPLASRDAVGNEGKSLGRWSILISQAIAGMGNACIMIFIVFGHELLQLWVGEKLVWTIWIVTFLAAGITFSAVQTVNYNLALGGGNIAPFSYASLVMAILTFLGTIVGTIWLGWELLDVALWMALVRVGRNFYLAWHCSKTFPYDFFQYLVHVYAKPVLVAILAILVFLPIKQNIPYEGIIPLGMEIAGSIFVYGCVFWFFVLDPQIKSYFIGIVRKFKRIKQR